MDLEWIYAVETVLGHYLQAICVDELETFIANIGDFSQGSLVLFENKPAQNTGTYNAQALINQTNALIDCSST